MAAIPLARGAASALLAIAAFVLWTAAHAQPQAWGTDSSGLAPIPPLAARVTDLTSTLNPADQQAIESKLAAWEARTGNQMVVLLVPSTQPEPIEAYALRVAEAWKIGRKGRDNGVVFVIAKNDRRMRLEVGYGLEGAIPDAIAKRIIAETVTPSFREGQFAAGINAGVDRVVAAADKGEPAQPEGRKAAPATGDGFNLETLFILLFVVVPILGSVLRAIFGKFVGSTLGAGIVGAGAWLVAHSIAIALLAAVVAWIVMLAFAMAPMISSAPHGRGGWGGGWGGGGRGGGGFGGGGFSGGGGSFGGGGASGGW